MFFEADQRHCLNSDIGNKIEEQFPAASNDRHLKRENENKFNLAWIRKLCFASFRHHDRKQQVTWQSMGRYIIIKVDFCGISASLVSVWFFWRGEIHDETFGIRGEIMLEMRNQRPADVLMLVYDSERAFTSAITCEGIIYVSWKLICIPRRYFGGNG